MRRVVMGVVLGALVAVASAIPAFSTKTSPVTTREIARCPQHAMFLPGRQGIGTTARLVAALRRDVPRAFRNLTSMGRPAWPHYEVTALYSLVNGPEKRPTIT